MRRSWSIPIRFKAGPIWYALNSKFPKQLKFIVLFWWIEPILYIKLVSTLSSHDDIIIFESFLSHFWVIFESFFETFFAVCTWLFLISFDNSWLSIQNRTLANFEKSIYFGGDFLSFLHSSCRHGFVIENSFLACRAMSRICQVVVSFVQKCSPASLLCRWKSWLWLIEGETIIHFLCLLRWQGGPSPLGTWMGRDTRVVALV